MQNTYDKIKTSRSSTSSVLFAKLAWSTKTISQSAIWKPSSFIKNHLSLTHDFLILKTLIKILDTLELSLRIFNELVKLEDLEELDEAEFDRLKSEFAELTELAFSLFIFLLF